MKKLKEKLLEEYFNTLRRDILAEKVNGNLIISLPLQISGGHSIEIFVQERQSDYLSFSDNAKVISDLWLSGVSNIERGKNRKVIEEMASCYNLTIDKESNNITAIGKIGESGTIINNMIQAFLKISSLEYFKEIKPLKEEKIVRKVRKIVEKTEIKFRSGPGAHLSGKEVKKIDFDFIVENGKLEAIKAIDRNRPADLATLVEAWGFKLDDIKEVMKDIVRIVIYDDNNKLWTDDLMKLLERRSTFLPISNSESIKAVIKK